MNESLSYDSLPDHIQYDFGREWIISSGDPNSLMDLRRTLNGQEFHLTINRRPGGFVDVMVYRKDNDQPVWRKDVLRTTLCNPTMEQMLDWADNALLSPMELLSLTF